jgi:signal transduction histidine kinase
VPRLIVIKGADQGKQFELNDPVISIGRDSGSQLRLHDTEISRRHAELRRTGEGYRLLDVGSVNGTFVNDVQITESPLQQGDRVQVGQSLLLYSTSLRGSGRSDLADRINMIARQENELSSAIVRTVAETEGSRILAHPQEAGTPWLQGALVNLAVLYEAVHTTSHILDLDQLLEKIMDLIFKTIEADRGCIMLRQPEGVELEPKALRWRQGQPPDEKMTISRTIMDHVLRNRQGVIVSDAARDERFNSGQSIVRFGIREAICVPMKGRHETLGVLYLDTAIAARDAVDGPLIPSRFTEDHLKLAIAIAHQAALAVEDTRYHQAMVQAERLAAIGQAMAALSHHIKNILQGIKSGSEVLKIGLQDKDEAMLLQGWKIVEKNQGKIYDLVLDMLGYSKEREPILQSADFNSIVRDVLELQAGRARELNAVLEARLQESLPEVMVDPEGIHRAVLNIVGNALDAVEGVSSPRVVVSTALKGTEWLECTVVDNGPGIPSEKLNDIFKPFVSSKGSRGTGLGLAVSRKILREHGGDVLVTSRPGKGSKFVLQTPLKSPLAPELSSTRTDLMMPPLRPE